MASNAQNAPEPPKKRSTAMIVLIVLGCVGLPVIVAVIGIIAAIAIPSFLRARVSANEAQNLGDIRSLISAEMVYETESGRYGTLACLERPASCIKGYSGPAFLGEGATRTEKSGYRRTFELGPGGRSFAYVVVPLEPGRTGVRAFCGDATGVICQTNGALPSTTGGRCDAGGLCTPLS